MPGRPPAESGRRPSLLSDYKPRDVQTSHGAPTFVSFPFVRRPVLLAACLVLIIITLLSACQSGAAVTPTKSPAANAGPTPTIRVYAAPTATPRSVEGMTAALANNPSYLASQHLAAGTGMPGLSRSVPAHRSSGQRDLSALPHGQLRQAGGPDARADEPAPIPHRRRPLHLLPLRPRDFGVTVHAVQAQGSSRRDPARARAVDSLAFGVLSTPGHEGCASCIETSPRAPVVAPFGPLGAWPSCCVWLC